MQINLTGQNMAKNSATTNVALRQLKMPKYAVQFRL